MYRPIAVCTTATQPTIFEYAVPSLAPSRRLPHVRYSAKGREGDRGLCENPFFEREKGKRGAARANYSHGSKINSRRVASQILIRHL